MNAIRIAAGLTLAMVLTLAIGCDRSHDSSGDEPMPPAATSKTLTPEKFVLEYHTAVGYVLGDRVRESQSVLRLNRNDGTAAYEINRYSSDEPGMPVGLFQTRLDDAAFDKFDQLVTDTDLEQLKPGGGGGPGVAELSIQYEFQGKFVRREISARDGRSLEQLDPLVRELNDLTRVVRKSPASAIKATVAHKAADGVFELTLENIGDRPVAFADPRVFNHENEDRWAGVKVAELPEEKPGFTSPPLQWSRIGLPYPAGKMAKDPHVVLQAGKHVTYVTHPWKPRVKGARYLIVGVYSNYLGDHDWEGTYQIRGAVFSDSIQVSS